MVLRSHTIPKGSANFALDILQLPLLISLVPSNYTVSPHKKTKLALDFGRALNPLNVDSSTVLTYRYSARSLLVVDRTIVVATQKVLVSLTYTEVGFELQSHS